MRRIAKQVPFERGSIRLETPREFDPVGADLQRKERKDNHAALRKFVKAKLAAESEVGTGIWMSFDLRK